WIMKTMGADVYLDAVKDNFWRPRDWYNMDKSTLIFQQDNAQVHTARKVMDYFKKNKKSLFFTALLLPNSSDLNPIEHIWAYMKCQQY
ncbi:hypothetical protein BG015_002230, partial [Linnemannia schmuckeri]